MAQSIRILYRRAQGRIRVNYNWPPIKENSAVVITAGEYAYFDSRYVLGEANVYVTNIGPHDPEPRDGGVEFYLHVDWEEPLDVMVTITVFDNEVERAQDIWISQ